MKRIILGLLFDGENFYLSRNFRLQRLGNLGWLQEHFQIFDLASFVDEVAVFHVARTTSTAHFAGAVRTLSENLFVPMSVGGGIRSVSDADVLFRSGADRLVFSGSLWNEPSLVAGIGQKYGQQSIVGVLNYSHPEDSRPVVRIKTDEEVTFASLEELPIGQLQSLVGEIVLQSIDKDGTGQGFPLDDLSSFPNFGEAPWIAAGGFGSTQHVSEALSDSRIEAVLTSNLLAFVGNGLQIAREDAVRRGVSLAHWESFMFDPFPNSEA